MKILFCVTKAECGGAQTYVKELIKGLKEHEIVLVSGADGWLIEWAKSNRIKTIVLDSLVPEISVRNDPNAVLELMKLFKEESPDLVHLNSSKAGIIGKVAAWMTNVPAVYTAHGWAFTKGVGTKRALIAKLAEFLTAPLARKIICVSAYDTELARNARVGKEMQLRTIHNGIPDIEPDFIANAGESKSLPIFTMVARFCDQKDHMTLLQAVGRAKQEFKIRCIGDGPKFKEIKKRAADMGLAPRFEFVGNSLDVPSMIKSSSALILISHWEGLPISVLEGMRASLPILASRVGGMPELVEEGKNGFLIPARDPCTLADRLDLIALNPALRAEMGKRSRTIFLRRFGVGKMIAETMQVYEEAQNRHSYRFNSDAA